MKSNVTRRRFLGYSVIAAPTVLGLSSNQAGAQSVLKRKNIDDLTPTELKNYVRAVEVLKERSAVDQDDKAGYVYQARLHNLDRKHPDGSVGACEHGSEEFLPWHRAHLHLFEKLLQSTHKDSANVTIPYWDWTKSPTGTRFPAAFEDSASALHHTGRWPAGSGAPDAIWDADKIKTIVAENDWNLFAGNSKSAGQTYGELESDPHNALHPIIGPIMGGSSTASDDPIYWSFHAFIDLIWSRWQRRHSQTYQCGTCKLWLEPDHFTVAQMTNTKDFQYEYDYDFSIDDPSERLLLVGGTPLQVRNSDARTLSAGAEPESMAKAAPEMRTLLRLNGVKAFADITYNLNVYIYPKGTDFEELNAADKGKYLTANRTIWRMHAAHTSNHKRSGLYIDITKAIQGLGSAGWEVSVVAEASPLVEPNAEAFASSKTAENQRLDPLSNVVQSLSVERR